MKEDLRIHLGYGALIGSIPKWLPRSRKLLFSRNWGFGSGLLFSCLRFSGIRLFLDLEEVMTGPLPHWLRQKLAGNGPISFLAGTSMGLEIRVNGRVFCYTLEDGQHFHTGAFAKEVPLIRLSTTTKDLEKLVVPELADLLFAGEDKNLRRKYELLTRLEGLVRLSVPVKEGSAASIEITLNGKEVPMSVFTIKAPDLMGLMGRKVRSFQLFMSGRLRIQGDTMFAMTLQPLFE